LFPRLEEIPSVARRAAPPSAAQVIPDAKSGFPWRRMEISVTSAYPKLSSMKVGMTSRCPRCGEGPLFRGFLKIRDRCPNCRLSYAFADPADGPAYFVSTGIGILVFAFLLGWVLMSRPPIWLQLVVVIPMFLGAALASLRPVKAWLVAEQYINKAGDGRRPDLQEGDFPGRWR
jgi:uncharacterized protein (DUF983 family)